MDKSAGSRPVELNTEALLEGFYAETMKILFELPDCLERTETIKSQCETGKKVRNLLRRFGVIGGDV